MQAACDDGAEAVRTPPFALCWRCRRTCCVKMDAKGRSGSMVRFAMSCWFTKGHELMRANSRAASSEEISLWPEPSIPESPVSQSRYSAGLRVCPGREMEMKGRRAGEGDARSANPTRAFTFVHLGRFARSLEKVNGFASMHKERHPRCCSKKKELLM